MTKTEQYTIQRRWSWLTALTVTIECDPATPGPIKLGLAVKVAFQSGAVLRGAVLRGAVLSGADLRGADLSGAVLSGADLSGADLSDAVLSDAVLSGAVLRGADLSGAVLSDAVLSGAVLRGADLSGAVLSGAVLSGAVLRGADLSDADLRGAILSGADLSDAVLSGAPKIENIHQVVYEAASALGALDMTKWHCGTSHCRAGWVVTLAGDEGRALEERIGTPAAASLIYLASDPDLGKFPDFYCTNATALADMKARAEAEADRATGKS